MLSLSATVFADAPKDAPTSAKFSLKDAKGKEHSLADCKDSKAVVVVFLGTQCPINNAYVPTLNQMHKDYSSKGVSFYAINSNSQDTPQRIADHAKQHQIPFPVLKDTGNTVADVFKAERTPEAFVLDASGKILYRGRIDDQHGYKHRRETPFKKELVTSLDEVLAGKPVTTPVTAVEGCIISRVVKTKESGDVTYAKDVSRLMQKHCQECHRPNQIGPFSLLTYDDVVAWSSMVREVVEEKRMPPWHADPKHGKFANDRSLNKTEIETLTKWIDGGMPKGDDKDMPKAKEFVEGWRIGKPDVVLEMPTEFKVPSKAERKSIGYKNFRIPTNFKEDMWVTAAECKPGNAKVVHHILVYVRNAGDKRDILDGIGDKMLVAYAPGDMPSIFPEGMAKKVPKGSELHLQMHYTPIGTEETDKSSVGLILSNKSPKGEARTRGIANPIFEIGAGDDNYKVTSTTRFSEEGELLSLLPHMHLRGKSFEYKITYPDGKSETILKVPAYDFNWQTIYRFEKPIKMPAGTRIDCTAYFDNSSKNPNNPDPTKRVRWGEQTWEEMMIGFVDYVPVKK